MAMTFEQLDDAQLPRLQTIFFTLYRGTRPAIEAAHEAIAPNLGIADLPILATITPQTTKNGVHLQPEAAPFIKYTMQRVIFSLTLRQILELTPSFMQADDAPELETAMLVWENLHVLRYFINNRIEADRLRGPRARSSHGINLDRRF
jgi:hypothetical protein